jgi:hypothetical protein
MMADEEIDVLIEKANAGSGYFALIKQSECHRFARLVAAAERERWETVVFDGWRVLKGLDEAAAKRTTHQNVSDTLDALMRVLRA